MTGELHRAAFEGSPDAWDALCSRFEEFSINQSWAFGEGRRGDGWTVARDVWRDEGGEVTAAATVLRRRVRGVPLTYVSRGPLVAASGLAREEAERRFVACVRGYRRMLRLGETMVLASYQSLGTVGPLALREAGLRPLFPVAGSYAFTSVVDLTDADALLRGASSDWRNRYKRSAALLDRVVAAGGAQALLEAREVVGRLERDKSFRTNVTPSLLRALAAGRSRVFQVRDEAGRLVGALVVSIAGKRASRFLAGVLPEASRIDPGIARVLEVAGSRWAHEQGATGYDLEGLHPFDRGVTDYKLGVRGRMIATAGVHAASNPPGLAAAVSWVKRRGWETLAQTWRVSKPYFLHVSLRRASGARVCLEPLRLYRKDLEGSTRGQLPGFTTELLSRFDRADFDYRLATVAEIWGACRDLAPNRKECVVVLAKDGFSVAYGFVTWGTAEFAELESTLPLSGDEAYVSNCFVRPDFRGQGLYPFLLGEICGRLRARGVKAALIATSPYNTPSVRGIERAGFRPFREARFVRVGAWRRLRWTEPAPNA